MLDKLNDRVKDKMAHAIGHDFKDKPYRNRYVIEHDEDFEYLRSIGLAEKANALDMNYYYLTALGIEVICSDKPIFRQQYDFVMSKSGN